MIVSSVILISMHGAAIQERCSLISLFCIVVDEIVEERTSRYAGRQRYIRAKYRTRQRSRRPDMCGIRCSWSWNQCGCWRARTWRWRNPYYFRSPTSRSHQSIRIRQSYEFRAGCPEAAQSSEEGAEDYISATIVAVKSRLKLNGKIKVEVGPLGKGDSIQPSVLSWVGLGCILSEVVVLAK